MQKKRLRGTSPPGRLAAEQKAQTNGVHLFCRASLTHPALGFPPSDASVLRIFLRLLFFPGVALLSHLLRPWQDFEFDWHPYRLFPCVQQNSNIKKNVCFCATQRGASQSLISLLWICTTHCRTHTHFTFWMFHSRLSEEQPMIYSTLLKVSVIDRQHVYIKCIWKVFTAFFLCYSLTPQWMDGWITFVKNQELRNHMYIM